MPRKRVVVKREIIPDPKYSSELVARFIRKIMRDGKKSVAEGILYDALGIIEEKAKKPAAKPKAKKAEPKEEKPEKAKAEAKAKKPAAKPRAKKAKPKEEKGQESAAEAGEEKID